MTDCHCLDQDVYKLDHLKDVWNCFVSMWQKSSWMVGSCFMQVPEVYVGEADGGWLGLPIQSRTLNSLFI